MEEGEKKAFKTFKILTFFFNANIPVQQFLLDLTGDSVHAAINLMLTIMSQKGYQD